MLQRFFVLFLLFSKLSFAQQTVGIFLNDSSAFNGYTLISPFLSPKTYLIDNCGVKLYEWYSDRIGPAASVYLLEDGNLLRTYRPDSTAFSFGGAGGGIEILDPSSNIVWQYELNTDSTLSHHDIEILPNGNVLILAIEFIPALEGFDNGSSVTADRWSEMILEIDTSTNNVVWEWHAWDHLIQDRDSNAFNYGEISQHPGRIDINYAFDGSTPDWLHANSIDFNDDLNQIIINIPTFNEFWIIDHSTTTLEAADSLGGVSGKGGEILYRWGNPEAYRRGDSTDRVFEYQHDAHWIDVGLQDEGKIMVFNNGDRRLYSSVDIIDPPLDTNNSNNYILTNDASPFGPSGVFWSYADSANFFSRRVSGAQRLKNGNTLICSGFQGKLFEVENQTDSVVWEYIIPIQNSVGPISQGSQAIGNQIFRTHRFSPAYKGFDNLNLIPTAVLELNPLPSNCITYIRGCTDSLSCNYDSLAIVDDGSCVYPDFIQQDITICNGDSVQVGSNVYYSSGSFADTLTSTNGCDSMVTTNLTVLTITPVISQIEDSIVASSLTVDDNANFEWNTGETFQTIMPPVNGEYWVIVSDTNNCRSDTVFYNVDWITTSITDLFSSRIHIYPNPTSDDLNIYCKIQRNQNIQVGIYNLLGERVFFESIKNNKSEYRNTIDISMLPRGVYLLEVTSLNRLAKTKLVIE